MFSYSLYKLRYFLKIPNKLNITQTCWHADITDTDMKQSPGHNI